MNEIKKFTSLNMFLIKYHITNILFDLTSADGISPSDLAKIKSRCRVIKVITDFALDLNHSEDVWETYTEEVWLRSIVSRLWAADEILYFKSTANISSFIK